MIIGAACLASILVGFVLGWFSRRQVAIRVEAKRISTLRRELHDAGRTVMPHENARGTAVQRPIRFTSGPVSGPRRES